MTALNSCRTLRYASQILLALPFLRGGLAGLRNPTGPATQVSRFASTIRPVNPDVARLMVRTNAAVMLGAGAALGFNIRPRAAALVLAVVLQPMNLVGHNFWQRPTDQRSAEVTAFIINLAVTGGLLALEMDLDG